MLVKVFAIQPLQALRAVCPARRGPGRVWSGVAARRAHERRQVQLRPDGEQDVALQPRLEVGDGIGFHQYGAVG